MEKNNKKSISIIIALLVFLLYTVITFLLFENKTEIFWYSYAFSTLAFIIQIAVYDSIGKEKVNEERMFQFLPLIIISTIYLAIQVLVSLIIIGTNFFSIAWTIILQLTILIIYVILALLLNMARKYINE